MPERQHIDMAISQAFHVRKFVLKALLNRLPDSVRHPPNKSLFFSSDGWRLFLRVERCAYPLNRFFEDAGFENLLPDEFRNILREEADWEWQRISSAKRQLQAIATWASENDCRPIVLKGGLGVAENTLLDLNDLDILLPKSDGGKLFDALIEDGYRASGTAGRYARNGLWRDGALAVDIRHGVHEGLENPAGTLWKNAGEVTSYPGLWRLAPTDHLWHVLIHNVGKHPERRGRIRDLLLLRSAIEASAPGDIATAKRRASSHELSSVLNRTLDCVLRLSDGPCNNDPLEEIALLAYLLGNRRENRSRVFPMSGMVNRWVCALLAGPVERKSIWEVILVRGEGVSKHKVIRYLELTAPWLGRAVIVSARAAHRTASLARACVLTIRIRRLRARYLRYFREQDQRGLAAPQ